MELNDSAMCLYEAINLGKSGLSVQLTPKNLDKVKNSYDRENKNRKASLLFENSKLQQALQALGYSDAQFNSDVSGGFRLDFYSAEHKAGILALDSDSLCYDRVTPNGQFRLRERTAGSLEGKPALYTVNLFTLSGLADNESKIKYLTEQCGIPLVGKEVNYAVTGF